MPSDPQKQARVRVINRAFSEAITKLGGAAKLHTDPVLQNATRFALKLGEHTDGRDVKSNLKDNYSCVQHLLSASCACADDASQRAVAAHRPRYICAVAVASDTVPAIADRVACCLHLQMEEEGLREGQDPRLRQLLTVRHPRGELVGAARVGRDGHHRHPRRRQAPARRNAPVRRRRPPAEGSFA